MSTLVAGTYAEFLDRKRRVAGSLGITADVSLPSSLYDWQRAIVRWALRKGRAALFADCGLGKSFMQVAWANAISGRVLILAPLCVAEQTVREAAKLDIPVVYARTGAESDARITITNYERLDGFDPADYSGVVLDESSILKAFDGKTRTKLIETFTQTKYRLCCTATPSPNDISELANHAEFLGLMSRAEFLASWFVHDDAGWRMKGHVAGIGSEGYESIRLGRRFLGFELKPQYATVAARNLATAEHAKTQGSLFAAEQTA